MSTCFFYCFVITNKRYTGAPLKIHLICSINIPKKSTTNVVMWFFGSLDFKDQPFVVHLWRLVVSEQSYSLLVTHFFLSVTLFFLRHFFLCLLVSTWRKGCFWSKRKLSFLCYLKLLAFLWLPSEIQSSGAPQALQRSTCVWALRLLGPLIQSQTSFCLCFGLYFFSSSCNPNNLPQGLNRYHF